MSTRHDEAGHRNPDSPALAGAPWLRCPHDYGRAAAQNTSTPSSANYVAFALQQPFPNLVWRADLAMLYDVEGGLLVQPAVRRKPGGPWAIEAFYNFIDGDLGSKEPTYNALSTSDYADEATVRINYQF